MLSEDQVTAMKGLAEGATSTQAMVKATVAALKKTKQYGKKFTIWWYPGDKIDITSPRAATPYTSFQGDFSMEDVKALTDGLRALFPPKTVMVKKWRGY